MYVINTVLSIALVSCSTIEDSYTIEDIDGVKHIHNHAPAWGDTLKVALEFVQKIGVLEGEDWNYLLHRPEDIALDSKGNIYIMDAGNYRIQKYTASGKYLATIGRRGQGPGEFAGWMRCMDIINDTLTVVHTSIRFTQFTLDGREVNRFTGYAFNHLRHFSTGEYAINRFVPLTVVEGVYTYDPAKTALVYVVSKDEGLIVRQFGKPIFFDDASETIEGNKILFDVDSDDNVYVSFEKQNRIDKYTYDGEMIFSVDRPLNFKVLEKPVWVDAGPERKIDREPQFILVTKAIGIDHENRIWLVTANRQLLDPDTTPAPGEQDDDTVFDFHIFNADGIFLGALPMPVSWREFEMRIFGSRMFLLEAKDEMTVHEYRIVEK